MYINPNEPDFFVPDVSCGLTKKEYISIAVMQGLLANPNDAMTQMSTKSFHPLDVAESAVAYADALINELNKGQ